MRTGSSSAISVTSFLWPLGSPGSENLALVRVADGAVIAATVEAAFESASRRRGLLGRTSLSIETAFVIAPCSAVHTFFMRFPIDVVFVSRDGSVLKVSRDVVPWRITGTLTAFATIEFAAGAVARSGLAPGDVLSLVPRHGQTAQPA